MDELRSQYPAEIFETAEAKADELGCTGVRKLKYIRGACKGMMEDRQSSGKQPGSKKPLTEAAPATAAEINARREQANVEAKIEHFMRGAR